MAETAIGGIGGDITFPVNHVVKLGAWEATHVTTADDTTGFEDNGYTRLLGLLTSLSARAMGVAKNAAGDTVQGHGGNIDLGDFVMKFSSWSLDIVSGLGETTGFVDAGYRVVEPLLISAGGQAVGTVIQEDCPFNLNALGNPFTAGDCLQAITLTAANALTFAGNAHIGSVQMSRPVDGRMACAINFTFDGRITPTWAANCPLPTAVLAAVSDPSLLKGDMVLTVDANRTISFPGVVHGIHIVRPENGVCTVSYDIASRGEIAYTDPW